MLASHLSPAGRTAALPQLQSSKAVTSTTVLRSTNLGRSSWCHQQTRGIKFEFWPWYLHSDSQRDQGRHRISKSAYIEALNRKLLRHHHHRMHISHSTIKGFMCSAFHNSKPGFNLQKLKHDLARTTSTHSQATSGSINSLHKATTVGRSGGFFGSAGAQFPLKYDIDPITNRKVFKQDSTMVEMQGDSPTHNIPVKKFDGYKPPTSQLPHHQPHYEPSPMANLRGAPISVTKRKSPYITDSELYRDGRTVKEELGVYKPFQYNEPDGHLPPPPDPVEKALNDGRTFAEELGIYKPFRHNEPDGRLPSAVDSSGRTLGDGQKLEEELRIYTPFQHNEPDGHFPPPPDPVEEALNEYDQRRDPKFDGYSAFRYNEPDGHLPLPPDPVKSALDNYDQKWEPKLENDNFFFDEDFGTEKSEKFVSSTPSSGSGPTADSITSKNAWLGNQTGHPPAGISNSTTTEPKEEKEGRRKKMEEDFDASSNQATKGIEAATQGDNARAIRKRAEEFELERSELLNHHGHVRGRIDARLKEIAELDREKARKEPVLNYTSEFLPSQVSSGDENVRNQRSVTGNFVRDFPEEYAVSWGSDGGPLLPKTAQSETDAKSPSREIHVSEFSRDPATPRLQTSLERNREASKGTHNPQNSFISKPVGFQDSNGSEGVKKPKSDTPLYVSSYGTDLPQNTRAAQNADATERSANDRSRDKLKKTLANELRRIYEDTYGAIGPLHRQPIDQPSAEGAKSVNQSTGGGSATTAPNPTFYKILAYSPDTHSVLTTETTSIIPPDNMKPLSPATVLLRMSKPAKFLPHIAPLLKEGYEIASGNGHVLVFRKVRDGRPPELPAANVEPDTPARKMTNPIDGMQSILPATGNFASPTGFVNHDLPEYHTEPFNSGIDTGHDEHIYGGSRAGWQDQGWEDREAQRGKGRKRVKRLLVGAVWVGGLSYAVGVVAEYFRTGGADGNGPVGL